MDGLQKVNALLVFLDTEFKDFVRPDLISIALVAEDGRAIYYGDPQYPGQIVKEYPDGRRQLVDIDEKSVVTVIKDDLMPMPSEKTRALIWAAEFLQELRSGTDTPAAIREQAIRVLRHFPEARSIEQEVVRQLHRRQESGKSSWLLPVDYYERPKSP